MKKALTFLFLILYFLFLISPPSFAWGFWAHQRINYQAVFLLPPEMMVLYKPYIGFITEHAIDPDKRRYAVAGEGPRHYLDIDHYGKYPYDSLPRKWSDAIAKFSEDSVRAHGIVPWHVQTMLQRLTIAFKEKDLPRILKNSAELGHYIADAHVPLHASSNHNGQFTNQKGIHAFWESRIPELLTNKEFDLFIGKAAYIKDAGKFIWQRVLESALAADSVLAFEKALSASFPEDRKYAFELRNGAIIRQYSAAFTIAFDRKLNGMVERRMRQSIYAIACFWYTAWLNAGQPDLAALSGQQLSEEDKKELEQLNALWNNGTGKMLGREE